MLNINFRQEQLDLTKTLVFKADVGSDSTVASENDVALVSAIAATTNNCSVVQSNNAIKTTYILLEGQANSDTVRELVFKKSDNTVQAREVIPDTSKNTSLQVEVTTSVIVDIN